MPNWCSNKVLIQGDPDEVEKLLMFVEEGGNPFSFNKIIVMPPELKDQSSPAKDDIAVENTRLYGAKDWYEWANKYWGTKWNSSDTRINYDQTTPMMPGHRTVRIEFETAWAPPTPVYETLAKKFPNTNIYVTYDEPGVGFSGWKMYKGGDLYREDDYDVSIDTLELYMSAREDIFELIGQRREKT